MPVNQQEKKGVTSQRELVIIMRKIGQGGMNLGLRSFTGVPLGIATPVINISWQFQQTGSDQSLITRG